METFTPQEFEDVKPTYEHRMHEELFDGQTICRKEPKYACYRCYYYSNPRMLTDIVPVCETMDLGDHYNNYAIFYKSKRAFRCYNIVAVEERAMLPNEPFTKSMRVMCSRCFSHIGYLFTDNLSSSGRVAGRVGQFNRQIVLLGCALVLVDDYFILQHHLYLEDYASFPEFSDAMHALYLEDYASFPDFSDAMHALFGDEDDD